MHVTRLCIRDTRTFWMVCMGPLDGQIFPFTMLMEAVLYPFPHNAECIGNNGMVCN